VGWARKLSAIIKTGGFHQKEYGMTAVVKRFLWCCSSAVLYVPILCAHERLQIPKGVIVSSGLSPSLVAECALFLAVLLLWTVIVGRLLKFICRIPEIAGQIIAGIVLGPSLLNITQYSMFDEPLKALDWKTGIEYVIASPDLFVTFVLLLSAVVTVPYLLWIAGHETDVKDLSKVGFSAVVAGFLGTFTPIFMVGAAAYCWLADSFTLVQALGLGLVFGATSVSIPVAMFLAQNRMHLRVAKATLGAAVIDDIVAVVALSLFFIVVRGGTFGLISGVTDGLATGGVFQAVGFMVLSLVVLCLVGYYLVPLLVRFLHTIRLMHLLSSFANGIMLLFFAFAELIGGLSGITGAYFAGLFHRRADTRHQVEKVISPFLTSVLLPLFLGSIGFQIDIKLLTVHQWVAVAVILAVALLAKYVACFIAIWSNNFFVKDKQERWTALEGFLFGSAMSARGEVGLVVASILSRDILTHNAYIMAIVVIVLSTIASPIMLSLGLYFFDRRTKTQEKMGDYRLNIGTFNVIGSSQMFTIILGVLAGFPEFKRTTVALDGGRKIVHVRGHNVKIILSPHEGIMFEGDREKIEQIVVAVKHSMACEIERISMG
jgi:Kef-type K+ transport system membrane component KefB